MSEYFQLAQEQEQAVLSHRVEQVEKKIDKIDTAQDTIQMHVSKIADAVESMAKDSATFRRETSRKLECIVDTWDKHIAENGPLLAEIREKREESKDLRKSVRKAWFVAGGIGIGGALWTWLGDAAKALFRIKTGV